MNHKSNLLNYRWWICLIPSLLLIFLEWVYEIVTLLSYYGFRFITLGWEVSGRFFDRCNKVLDNYVNRNCGSSQ